MVAFPKLSKKLSSALEILGLNTRNFSRRNLAARGNDGFRAYPKETSTQARSPGKDRFVSVKFSRQREGSWPRVVLRRRSQAGLVWDPDIRKSLARNYLCIRAREVRILWKGECETHMSLTLDAWSSEDETPLALSGVREVCLLVI